MCLPRPFDSGPSLQVVLSQLATTVWVGGVAVLWEQSLPKRLGQSSCQPDAPVESFSGCPAFLTTAPGDCSWRLGHLLPCVSAVPVPMCGCPICQGIGHLADDMAPEWRQQQH